MKDVANKNIPDKSQKIVCTIVVVDGSTVRKERPLHLE